MTVHIMQCEWGGGRGSKPTTPHKPNFFFDEKWKKEKGEIGGRCLHFLHC